MNQHEHYCEQCCERLGVANNRGACGMRIDHGAGFCERCIRAGWPEVKEANG